MEREEKSLATEMLQELKQNLKRWFKVAVIELCIILIMGMMIVGMVIVYLTVPVEEESEIITYAQDADTEGDSSPISQTIGE